MKRLAIEVSDHALDYIDFEGAIGPQWLLIKRRDAAADARRDPVSTQPESIRSGRTVERVAKDG